MVKFYKMKKLLGIVILSFSLSSCSDIILEVMHQSRYLNRALYPNETINLMGRECVCIDENTAGQVGIRDNLIGFRDDKLGYIKYRFDLETSHDYKTYAHGNYFVYENFDVINRGRWKMNMRGKIFLDGDENNRMRFHLREEVYKDNNLEVEIKNNNYPEGKFFKIDLILKNRFYYDLYYYNLYKLNKPYN